MQAILAVLVVEVRPGCEAGGPHVGDNLTLADPAAVAGLAETGQVAIERGDVARVLQDQRVPIAAFPAPEDDLAITRGFNRRTHRGGVVHALMRPDGVQNRVAAGRIES